MLREALLAQADFCLPPFRPYDAHQDIANRMTAANYKATFFVNGFNFRCIYDVPQVQSVRRSLNQGYEIARECRPSPSRETQH